MFTANETVKECADGKPATAGETVVSLLATDPTSKAEVENTKEITSVPSMAGKNVASELAAKNDSNRTSRSSASSPVGERTLSLPADESKVELRMDEITSKFKNAFERMAELESLQLSMENDTDDGLKSQWVSQNRSFCKLYKPTAHERMSQERGNAGSAVLVTAKEERLSPVAGITPVKVRHNSETQNEFEAASDINAENTVSSEWSYEEQFKKLYELGDEPDRKDFLDKLFAFMQQRGTPVNRVPIMAKQTLDLYLLYKLVVERGGLVEVINKKIWRGIIKGLNLPSSVTSAAFTLRTQYMKYIYPYECSTLKLSTPNELQCAIDGNRRDTSRRPSIGHYTSMVEPEVGFYSGSTSPKSNCSSPTLKRASSPTMVQSMVMRVPSQNEFVTPSFHGNNGIGFSPSIQRIMTPSSENRTFKYDVHSKPSNYGHLDRTSYEPPCKKSPTNEGIEKHINYSHTPWANIKIRMSGRDVHENGGDISPNNGEENHHSISAGKSPKQLPVYSFEQINDNSMVVSIELNGVRYQGVLYAQRR